MSGIIEVRLKPSFVEIQLLEGRIHSKFDKAINIEFIQEGFQSRLVTLLSYGHTGVPDSLVISNKYFRKVSLLPIMDIVIKEKLNFTFDGLDEKLRGNGMIFYSDQIEKICLFDNDLWGCEEFKNCSLSRFLEILENFNDVNNIKSGFSHMSWDNRQKILGKLRKFCELLIEGRRCDIEKVFLSCVGVGYGLTPSSDDALIGIFAIIKSGLLGLKGFFMDSSVISPMMWDALGELTSDVSRKYLFCAMEGRFSDGLRNLVKGIINRKEQDYNALLHTIVSVGSTSGMDTLKGIEIIFEEMIESRSSSKTFLGTRI